MLNRRHVRVKVMQVLYMYWQGGKDMSVTQTIKEFDKNVHKTYQLYLYYLAFLKELDHFIDVYDSEVSRRLDTERRSDTAHLKLKDNTVLKNLLSGDTLNNELEKNHVIFDHSEDENLVRKVFLDLKNSERYNDYLNFSVDTIQQADIILHIFKHYTEHFPQFEQHIEEQFSNFQDDYKIAFSMLKKTVQKLNDGNPDFFVELVNDHENTIEYGHDLLEKILLNQTELKKLVEEKVTKWDPNQIAVTDAIILRMGVAEFMYFPTIPSTVTINEYVELAKNYSPPQSKKFINGVLDIVSKELQNKNIE